MRIDAYNQVNQIYQSNKPKKTTGAAGTDKGSFSDALQLSQAGKDIQIAKQAVKEAPDVREDKVSALKAQLASGTYNITGKDAAEKLVNNYFDNLF